MREIVAIAYTQGALILNSPVDHEVLALHQNYIRTVLPETVYRHENGLYLSQELLVKLRNYLEGFPMSYKMEAKHGHTIGQTGGPMNWRLRSVVH